MLSSVFLSGRTGEVIDETHRYIEVDRIVPNQDHKFVTDKFIVRSVLGKGSNFMKFPVNSLVIFKGRLENDEKLGTILVAELEEIYKANSFVKVEL